MTGSLIFPTPAYCRIPTVPVIQILVRGILVLVPILSACDNSRLGSYPFTADTFPSGTVRVRNDPPDPDAAPGGFQVNELFRVGSGKEGDRSTTFTQIRDLEVDGEGRIYVLDRGAPSIPVFGRRGEHVGDIGGPLPGDGPGEFRDPRTLLLDQQGRLVVMDLRNRRYTAFKLDGDLVDTYRRVGAGGNPVAGHDGKIWETASGGVDPETRRPTQLLFIGKKPEDGWMLPIDTVLRPSLPEEEGWLFEQRAGGAVIQGTVPVPFTPKRLDRWDPRGGFWTGTTDALRFIHISPEGDTLRIVERAATPRRVTVEDRDRAVEGLTDQYGENLAVEVDDVPDVMPLWKGFFIDPEGRLWVERFQPPGAPPLEPRTWEVYDPDGVYMGALDLLMTGEPTPSLGNDRLAGSVTGELGVPYVIVYELLIGGP